MFVNIAIFSISLAAIYHAFTFALWLRQNGNTAGAKIVYIFVIVALGLMLTQLNLI